MRKFPLLLAVLVAIAAAPLVQACNYGHGAAAFLGQSYGPGVGAGIGYGSYGVAPSLAYRQPVIILPPPPATVYQQPTVILPPSQAFAQQAPAYLAPQISYAPSYAPAAPVLVGFAPSYAGYYSSGFYGAQFFPSRFFNGHFHGRR